ncbi:hypothetical protein LSH36_58g16031 [Paralvinella palmiformis]|uniref:Band 7 domain-containing protein n=1 Tax=Paralvinella palmiformis TaxID=53620 RepID=A0AAD9K514_9ANNE|nr:hypothetical protein LSH36_58g16031 [Paralvinella palmiformis]
MFKITSNIRRLQVIAPFSRQQARSVSGAARINTGILFVPQQEAWVIERFGKFKSILEPGLNFLIPVVDCVKHVQSLKELAIDIPQQSAITADNVNLNIDGVLYLRVQDPYKASYGVEDAEFAITQLAQTTMRSEIGKISLDKVFRERDSLNINIVEAINKAADVWGLSCKRYEIRNIKLPSRVQEAMQMQVEAERKKRATILESEGVREAEINVAEGQKRARVLNSEAYRTEKINQAVGEAEAILATAKAKAEAIERIAVALGKKDGKGAVSVSVAEHYINAFSNLAKTGNTLILPTNTGDVSSMVAQAMSIYKTLNVETLSTQVTRDPVGDMADEEGQLLPKSSAERETINQTKSDERRSPDAPPTSSKHTNDQS